MSFNVQNIIGTVNKSGVAKSSNYEVLFTLPAGTTFTTGQEDLRLRAESVSIPSRSIASMAYRTYGQAREVGYSAIYSPISVSFLLSEDLRERLIFTAWQDLIVGPHRDSQFAFDSDFEIGYYDNYTTDITINFFDDKGDKTYTLSMIEAYPKTVNELGLSYGTKDALRLAVQFQYRYFTENT